AGRSSIHRVSTVEGCAQPRSLAKHSTSRRPLHVRMRSARPSRPWTATLALLLGIAALIPLSGGPEARAAEPAARRADVVPSPAARAGEPDAATHEGWWWPLQPE